MSLNALLCTLHAVSYSRHEGKKLLQIGIVVARRLMCSQAQSMDAVNTGFSSNHLLLRSRAGRSNILVFRLQKS